MPSAAAISRASSCQTTPSPANCCFLLLSLSATATTRIARPQRRSRRADCSASSLKTPPPIVPKPAMATLNGDVLGALMGRRRLLFNILNGLAVIAEKRFDVAKRLARALDIFDHGEAD